MEECPAVIFMVRGSNPASRSRFFVISFSSILVLTLKEGYKMSSFQGFLFRRGIFNRASKRHELLFSLVRS